MDDISIAEDKLPQAVSLITGTTILGIFYTLVLVLYYRSAQLSHLQLRKESDRKIKRRIYFRLILASIMVICATMDLTLSNIHMRIIYVDYGALPGGSLGLPAALHAITVARVRVFVNVIVNLLISGVLAWRVVVVWSDILIVKPIILLLYVAHAGILITDSVLQWKVMGQIISSSVVPLLQQRTFVASVISGTANLMIMSLMLVIRLLSIRWKHIKAMGKSEDADQYLGIAAIFIESYALETAWNLAFCITCTLKYAPLDNFFSPTAIQVDILTNLLVLYRVVSGRTCDRGKETHIRPSTLKFDRDAHVHVATENIDP